MSASPKAPVIDVQGKTHYEVVAPYQVPPSFENKDGAAQAVHNVAKATLAQKVELFEKVDNKGRISDDYILVGGDAFNSGYLLLASAICFFPVITTFKVLGISLASSASAICGIIGGLINIGAALVCFKEGKQALANKNYILAFQLLSSGFLLLAIGSVMILASTAVFLGIIGVHVGTFATIAAFLAANPWILPTLFFIMTIPVIIEVTPKVWKIWTHTDTGSKLQLNEVKQILQGDSAQKAQVIFEQYKASGVFDIEEFEAIQRNEISTEDVYDAKRALLLQTLRRKIKKYEDEHPKSLWDRITSVFNRVEGEHTRDIALYKFFISRYLSREYQKLSTDTDKGPKQLQELDDCLTLHVGKIKDLPQLVMSHKLSEKMEELQANIGVVAGLKAFYLITQLMELRIAEKKGDPIKTEEYTNLEPYIEDIQKKIREWNIIQNFRFLQQVLYVASFPIGLAALGNTRRAELTNGYVNLAMAFANIIPWVLDAKYPYERTTTRVIRFAEIEEIQQGIDAAFKPDVHAVLMLHGIHVRAKA